MPLLSAIIGGILALLFVTDYLRRKRSEVATIAQPLNAKVVDQKPSHPPPPDSKKSHLRSQHHHAADKVPFDFPSPPQLQPTMEFLKSIGLKDIELQKIAVVVAGYPPVLIKSIKNSLEPVEVLGGSDGKRDW
ncbi:hypothetical protein J5N97_009654 [Dioscorea zingiberensis]|uniref:Uncharacterized protein n=1 Tax=Dioscorea zingiberensis TaxID=325984 RepID=A0A9D5CYR4_9LILI|nr:hypothetical protein J5N97_009654 [Dioscorea zingiberensis]